VINRRKIIIALGAAALASPLSPLAQPAAKVWHVGFLHSESLARAGDRLEAFRAGMRELGYEEGVAALLSNIGNVHLNLFDYPKALECYDKALMIHEELGNKQGVAGILGNIGIVHGNLSEHAKALEYFEKSQAICNDHDSILLHPVNHGSF